MKIYRIGQTLAALEQMPETGEGTLVLLTSEELDKCTSLPGLEGTLHHTPLARDARGCKGEWRRGCLCGTVTTPRHTRTGNPIAFGYLLTGTCLLYTSSGPEQALDEKETGRVISQFLRSQPELDRALFIRRYWHLESIAALAHSFHLRESQVKSQMCIRDRYLIIPFRLESDWWSWAHSLHP